MKYKEMRIQAYDHLFEKLHIEREREKELKSKADDAVKNEVRTEWVEHAISEHRETVKLVKKLTAAVETLRMPSSLDGKETSEWVRPIWRSFHYRNYWWLPVAFNKKWFFLRMKTRMLFFRDKRVFKPLGDSFLITKDCESMDGLNGIRSIRIRNGVRLPYEKGKKWYYAGRAKIEFIIQ